MVRLLCIVSAMNAGGAETFLMKMLRGMQVVNEEDSTEYGMDFCVTVSENLYEQEINALGGTVHVIPSKSKHPIASFRAMRKLVKEQGYKRVIRVNEHSLSTLDLIAARMGGARIVAMRSSNASSPKRISRILHRLFFFLPRIVPNVRFAPSTEAAEYTFGKGCVEKGRAFLVHNGVDLGVYRYRADAREELRRELGISDGLLVGHVGRFNLQKNHAFLLDVFRKIKDAREDARLVLVGKGELEPEIRKKAEALGLLDSIIFTGVRKDVPELLSAMDVFVFPSFYEGMPNTVIEAQATGLPCVISDTVTKEANITGLVSYLPLGDPDAWAQAAISAVTAERKETHADFVREGYDTESVVRRFISACYPDCAHPQPDFPNS